MRETRGRDDRAGGRRGAVAGGRGQGRQAGDRGAGDFPQLRRRTVIAPLDLRVLRGDRVAIVGPNGAGKTTLLNMLTGAERARYGFSTLGTGIELAVFDQTRAALDPDQTFGRPDP
jgi:ATP-binding cassette subfamily F protein uup